MEKEKHSWVQDYRRAKRVRKEVREYTLRVVRDHGGGLWTFEDGTGQMYLAVLSREVSEFRRGRAGDAKWPHESRSADDIAAAG